MAELQVITARHGVATFVPAGQTIKIVNTSGSQVVDTWAFALPKPTAKSGEQEERQSRSEAEGKQQQKGESKQEVKAEQKSQPKATPKKAKKGNDLPSQEDAERATREAIEQGEKGAKDASERTSQKSTWGSYVPSIGWSSGQKDGKKNETQQQKDSRTWSSYFQSGKGFSSYVPQSASSTVSALASSHHRDPNKSYLQQLQDFSKTPVGAVGMFGLAAISGSGYGSSLYAGYQAWNAANAPDEPAMEFMSMPHSRAGTLHIRPKVNDMLVSNLREPMMTLVEDTSPGIHDTLIAACDPQRYKGLGVDKWGEHGSCAENLVLALKELNERAGLKGAKGVGADVTINNVPAPLNLFMNIPWDGEEGNLSFDAPKTKEGDYVRLKAERDVVVVMSACPQDILEINNKKPTDAHFIVEDSDAEKQAQQKQQRPTPRKINSSRATSTVATGDQADDEKSQVPMKKSVPQRRTVPAKKQTPIGQKKPTPPDWKPSVQQGAATAERPNGTTTPLREKKKPRKLAPRPKADA